MLFRSAAAFAKLDPAKRLEDLAAAVPFLKGRAEFGTKFATIGFCFGGGIVNIFATRFQDMAAGVPYYGSQVPAADAAKIKTPLLLQYASNDERINAGISAYEACAYDT